MTIEINDKSYIVGMWFSRDPITNNDWLACIVRDPEQPTRYKGWSRFRYVKDNKIWDSEDRKSWTTFTSREQMNDDEIIGFIRLMQKLECAYPHKDEIIVKGDIKKFFELAKDKSWMNLKEVKA